jgi:O-antigen/teichoic acid export membrane protein
MNAGRRTAIRNKYILAELISSGVPIIARLFSRTEPGAVATAESATVARQGLWVFGSSIASSGLGFVFWIVAARLFFSPEDVGIAGSLVSLSFLATVLVTLGLDISFVRFAPRVQRPLRLLGELMLITGGLGVVVGGILPFAVLSVGHIETGALLAFVGISIFLTVAQAWNELTNGAMMAAKKSHILAFGNTLYGILKLVALFVAIGGGAVALTAAYALPALVMLIINFTVIRRVWPHVIEGAAPHSLRELAPLSAGNWISGLVYSLPARAGPALMLLFLPAASVGYFFIALQLAEVLNYMSEAFSKSLFTHGSVKDHLPRSVTVQMRGLLTLILIPAVVIGIVLAPFALSIVGPQYQSHFPVLQLFLLAAIPKGYYLILRAQFNVERRPMALVASESVLGISTMVFLVVGLVLKVNLDLLPVAWVLGAVLGLSVGQSMAGRRRPVRGRPALNGR